MPELGSRIPTASSPRNHDFFSVCSKTEHCDAVRTEIVHELKPDVPTGCRSPAVWRPPCVDRSLVALFFSRDNLRNTATARPIQRVATQASATLAAANRPIVPRGHMALGGLLVDRGLITEAQLEAAVNEQKRSGRRLGRVLVDQGVLSPDVLLDVLSAQLGVPTTRINAYTVNPDALSALPEKVARRHTAFPLQKTGTTLLVALAMPKDLAALDDLRFASGCEIHTVLALEDEIIGALNRYYRDEWMPDIAQEEPDSVVIDSYAAQLLTRDEAAERSAVSVLERVIARAAGDIASDIHFEPRQEEFHVRFRVDGTFREVAVLPST